MAEINTKQIQNILAKVDRGEQLTDKEQQIYSSYLSKGDSEKSSKTRTENRSNDLFGVSLRTDFSGEVRDSRQILKTPPNQALQDTMSPEQLMKAHREDLGPRAPSLTHTSSIMQQLSGLDSGLHATDAKSNPTLQQPGRIQAGVDELENRKKQTLRLLMESEALGSAQAANQAVTTYRRLNTAAEKLRQQASYNEAA